MQIPDYEGKIEKESILHLNWGPVLKTGAHGRKGGRRHIRIQFSSVQSLRPVRLSATPWTAARQASLCITNSWGLLKFMSIKSAMPSKHLILCRPLLLLPSIFPCIRVFSSESVLCIRWPKYWN